jgi:hypothetical protein
MRKKNNSKFYSYRRVQYINVLGTALKESSEVLTWIEIQELKPLPKLKRVNFTYLKEN